MNAPEMSMIMVAMASLLNMTQNVSKNVSGKLDSFEAARTAFDTIGRSVRQATLLSYLGLMIRGGAIPRHYKRGAFFVHHYALDKKVAGVWTPDTTKTGLQAALLVQTCTPMFGYMPWVGKKLQVKIDIPEKKAVTRPERMISRVW